MPYPAALVLTLVIEIPIVLFGLWAIGWSVVGRRCWWARIGLGLVINLITHPLVWLVLRDRYGHGADLGWLAAAEVTVWWVEAGLIMLACRRVRADAGWAIALSGCANAASLAVGLLIVA